MSTFWQTINTIWENYSLEKIWEALEPLANTLESLSLHLEGSESTCFQFTESDLQKFKAHPSI
jgi:hypothetical protein